MPASRAEHPDALIRVTGGQADGPADHVQDDPASPPSSTFRRLIRSDRGLGASDVIGGADGRSGSGGGGGPSAG